MMAKQPTQEGSMKIMSQYANEFMFTGTICPFCGRQKRDRTYSCRVCYNNAGRKSVAANMVRKVLEALKVSKAVADSHTDRKTIRGPILTKFKFGGDAYVVARTQDGIPVVRTDKSIRGGFLSCYAGNCEAKEVRSKAVVGLLEFIQKDDGKLYLGFQMIPEVKTDVQLQIGNQTSPPNVDCWEYSWEILAKKHGQEEIRELQATFIFATA